MANTSEKLTNLQLSDRVGRTVSFMRYQPMQDWDDYFPTIEELDSLGTVTENGNIQYNEYELAFLAWITRPADPENLTEEQKAIMRYAMQLRMDFTQQNESDNDKEYEAKKAILAKYAAKNKKPDPADTSEIYDDEYEAKKAILAKYAAKAKAKNANQTS